MNIQPNNQTVEKCLKQRTYYIDFYQREYVWKKNIVKILLDDIFFTFETAYEEHNGKDLTAEVLAKYNWYYLNIYITNSINGKEYIVDGQQRLTTLTLIAIKLLHLASEDKEFFENILDTLKDCVYGKDKFKGNVFWIDNIKRKRIMQFLLENKEFTEKYESVTEETIHNRYGDISKYFNEKHLPKEKLHAFIMYFLERLVLVELKIEKDDTPMIFEVINDRGVALKPFEILKGKLVGALDKDDTEKYSELWETSINKLRGIEDDFFIDYLKGKFIYKRNADIEKSINNQYHRYIFENNEIANKLKFRKKDEYQIKNIKNFIENDLIYYADLYSRIRNNEYIYLSYNNNINDLSGQYQNIMAACLVNDKQESQKIETISKEIDRIYMLLRLNGIYNSNNYQEISYALNLELQNIEIEKYREVFDNELEERIKSKFNLKELNSLLDYDRFKSRGYDNLDRRPIRYFFARIEKYLCDNMGKDMENSVHYISTKTGHKTGYHIEHILARNNENIKYFETEDEFEIQRNKLGGLLLLYNMDNIISNNEKYFNGKRKTYNNGLFWGRTLIDSFYHKTNSRFIQFNEEFKRKTQMEFKAVENFDKEALNYRSKLLYEVVKQIWNVE
jgi:uncharacterized protein with ParB-like and HNH nuclease domain